MKNQNQEEVLDIFRSSGALLSGHFKLRLVYTVRISFGAHKCVLMDKLADWPNYWFHN